MRIEIKEVELGLYLTTKKAGVTYGQLYKTTNKVEAVTLFKRLINTYEVKGALYVMSFGSL
jgi:hypothetical protein